MFHTIECSYYPTDRDMDVVFYDFNGHYIGGKDGHYNNWSIYDANSLDDGIEKILRQRNGFERVRVIGERRRNGIKFRDVFCVI